MQLEILTGKGKDIRELLRALWIPKHKGIFHFVLCLVLCPARGWGTVDTQRVKPSPPGVRGLWIHRGSNPAPVLEEFADWGQSGVREWGYPQIDSSVLRRSL